MIDYKKIADACDFYGNYGFQRIEAPWLVSQAVSNITKPKDVEKEFIVEYNQKALVASGEQSFLYLYLKEFLPKGRFQTVTPCYRVEQFDFLHSKYFIKNELIDTKDVNKVSLDDMVDIAYSYFGEFIPEVEIVNTNSGYDIGWNGYELGSYGIRSCEFLEWVYGTGCAEPRLSKIIDLYNKQK